jgi:APA family basic amino acid/polyamine antiporter
MAYRLPAPKTPTLRRAIGLWLLVFYGVGVTVGAGIFALIGEIVSISGDGAPWAFLLAGSIAGFTGVSYALLAGVYPRAAGEAFYVTLGLGPRWGRAVGLAMVVVGIVSSAVIALAFTGYVGDLMPTVAERPLAVMLVAALAVIACIGVRESVQFAAAITVLELGTLVVIGLAGVPMIFSGAATPAAIALTGDPGFSPAIAAAPILAGALVAFFAFIGFEDIENLAEETIEPHRNLPLAILLTLAITVVIYVLLAVVAVAITDRAGLIQSGAPMRFIFESVTGTDGRVVSGIAALAMVNGILVQIIMASRILFGMARDGLIPDWLAQLHVQRRTPISAIGLVAAGIAVLVIGFPLLGLAQAASLVTLAVFAMVNVALWQIGRREHAHPRLRRWRHWGLLAAGLCGLLFCAEALRLILGVATGVS